LSIVDARTFEDSGLQTDVCIVGAGAAGITLAIELTRAGREVCLLESGDFVPDHDTQSLHDLESIGYPPRANYMSRARYFGGSCNLWAGRSMLLSEFDFSTRPWVPHSGWPIPHAELARHYPQAAEMLRLPGGHRFAIGAHRRRMSDDERHLLDDARLTPTVSLWAPAPMRFGSTYRRALQRAPRARGGIHAKQTHIHLNEAGDRVEALSVATLSGQRFVVRARTVVLACGGLENARLLLASRDRQPHGIGNRFDQVGRYFMDHPRAVFGKVRLRPGSRLPLLRGFPLPDGKVQVGLGLSQQTQRRERLLNHYLTLEVEVSGYTQQSYQSSVEIMKVLLRRGHAGRRWELGKAGLGALPDMIYLLTPREVLPHPVYRWCWLARQALPRKPRAESFVVVYFCEQPPDPASRVQLGPEVDRLGVNRLVLDWRIDAAVSASVLRLQQMLAERLEQTGLGHLENPESEPSYTDASHHMGTTRMSDEPRSGVVDRDGRVHGVDNLYVAGSSVFPCTGHANPTLTVVALALRLTEHLRQASLCSSRLVS
jgi:choline dehydrogenase-like flavoprotein